MKGVWFFVSLLGASSLLAFFGCAPKMIRVDESGQVPEIRSEIVEYAVTLLGSPYRSAAKGPQAFDCSGFVHHVFRRFDIILPPSTEGLDRVGYEIPRDDVLMGDLVMFQIGREHHVGIVINGLEFIHASKSRGVAIDSIDASYWKRNFSHFRRIF
ncbi:MAG: C40 family peptidase [Syntrophorhabdales bacterium]|jgi:probable lipoprotein NlpC